jgi:DNA mismatch repair ATPase MutL
MSPVLSGRASVAHPWQLPAAVAIPETFQFTKEMVQELRFIRQVDAKYLICQWQDRILVALDQHAVDERIRLERLQDEVFDPHGGCIRAYFLETPHRCTFSNMQVQQLLVYAAQAESWGWSWTCSPHDPTLVCLHSVPSLLGVTLAEPEFLLEFLTVLVHSGGSSLSKPPCILRLLNSRACRSAVMFGHVLSREQCEALLAALRRCRTPFQCAHGRPSLVPLGDLRTLAARPSASAPPNLERVSQLVSASRAGRTAPSQIHQDGHGSGGVQRSFV